MPSTHPPRPDPSNTFSRRDLLARSGMGFGLLGLAGVLADDARSSRADDLIAERSTTLSSPDLPLSPRRPHFAARAKQVVHLFMNGGPSHVDTFDPKPLLEKHHGKLVPQSHLRTERKTGAAMRSPFRFQKYGHSGIEVSELFSQTAACVDDMCIVRSMHADVPNHEPSLMLMNSGDGRLPRPSVGSWITYGLGTENQNLPGFIVMCPGGYPIKGTHNWRSAFLPGVYQGTYLDTKETEVDKLLANVRHPSASLDEQRRQLELLRALNRQHQEARPHEAMLEDRIQSFELAFRMQREAREAFDISREPKHVLELYGPGTAARQLLVARRLVERGVRFTQVYSGGGQPWDNHDKIAQRHQKLADEWDRPIAAFLQDLKRRGLLETTLVLWGGEFGRTPVAELPALSGRDHNHYGFSVWMAGGGVRGGFVHGATDELGFAAAEKPVHVHDLHATMLHLLGFDHRRLTYRHAGRDFRLTDVHGQVVEALIG